jgi:6-phosphogluconolactonase (cycloisomerase 2 family)
MARPGAIWYPIVSMRVTGVAVLLACLVPAVALGAKAKKSCQTQVERAASKLATSRVRDAVRACVRSPSGICYVVRSKAPKTKVLKRCGGEALAPLFDGRCVSRDTSCAPFGVSGPADAAGCLSCAVPPEIDCVTAALFSQGNIPPNCGVTIEEPGAPAEIAPVAAAKKKGKKKNPNGPRCRETLAREAARTQGLALGQALRGQTPSAAMRSSRITRACGDALPTAINFGRCPDLFGCGSDAGGRAGFESCTSCLVRAAAVAIAARTRPGRCGNGALDTPDESCETDASCTGGLHCAPPSTSIEQCTCFEACGDGIVESYEECDPNAAVTGCDAQSSCAASGDEACTCVVLPRFAFVANTTDNTLSVLTIDPATGALHHRTYATTGVRPRAVVVRPDGRFVYTANEGTNNVSMFALDPATGALSHVGTPGSVISGAGPRAIAVDPNGTFVYVANATAGTVAGFRVNDSNGALTAVPGSPFMVGGTPADVRVAATGGFAFVADESGQSIAVMRIAPATGALLAGMTFPLGVTPLSLALDQAGRFLYVVDQAGGRLVLRTIDATGGTLPSGETFNVGGSPVAMAIDPAGRFAWVIDAGGTVRAFAIDATTFTLTAVGGPIGVGVNPGGVSVDPSGKFVYVTNRGSNDVTRWLVDPATGALRFAGSIRTRFDPNAIVTTRGANAVSVTPRFIYAANLGSSDVSGFRVDPTKGTLTPVGNAVGTGTGPAGVAADPFGRHLYTANRNVGTMSFFSIDGTLGRLTSGGTNVPVGGSAPVGMAIEPSGRFAYVVNRDTDNVAILTLDPSTGAPTPLTTTTPNFGAEPAAIALDPAGRFAYMPNRALNSVSMFVVSAANGGLTNSGAVATGNGPNAVAVHPSGRFAFVVNGDSGTVSSYAIEPTNGLLSPAGTPVTVGTGPASIAVHPDGRLAFVGNPGSIEDNLTFGSNDVAALAIDPNTGVLSFLRSEPILVKPTGVAVDPSGTFLYVGTGFGNLLTYAIGPGGVLTQIDSAPAEQTPASLVGVPTLL